MGFEPTTLALARRCSTTELFPLNTVYFLTLAWLESQHSWSTEAKPQTSRDSNLNFRLKSYPCNDA
jgi:hypothetical protein